MSRTWAIFIPWESEELFVGVHQKTLAYRGTGLLSDEIVETGAMEIEPSATEADGAGRDKNDLPAFRHQARDGIGDGLHPLRVERAVRPGDGVGADLHDDAVGACQQFCAIPGYCVFSFGHFQYR